MEPTATAPFAPEMQAAYERARAKLDPARLKQFLFELTDIHSPTGATRGAAEFVASRMAAMFSSHRLKSWRSLSKMLHSLPSRSRAKAMAANASLLFG
jgi:hypothetical protein